MLYRYSHAKMTMTDITANIKLQALIKERKPLAAENTRKSYASILKSLFYRHHAKEEPLNLEWFKNQEIIMNDIKNGTLTKRPILTAIIAITENDENTEYKKYLMELSAVQKTTDDSQTMNEKQEENWLSFDEVKAIYKTIADEAKPLLKSEKKLDKKEYELCLDFIILSLTSGIYMDPRRSLDWTEMKTKNYDPENDNYVDLDNRVFVFNKYKTAKQYGEQKINIPSKLAKHLRRWIRHSTQDYLLTTYTNFRISVSRLTHIINKIFGKHISTSMLRHIYLTNVYKDVPSIKEMNQMAKAMGHTTTMALQYVKKPKN